MPATFIFLLCRRGAVYYVTVSSVMRPPANCGVFCPEGTRDGIAFSKRIEKAREPEGRQWRPAWQSVPVSTGSNVMVGTIINIGSIVAGSLVGVAVGARLPERVRQTVLNGLGLLTVLVGLQMALGTKNVMIVLGAILLGGILGEMLSLHDGLERLGTFLQSALAKDRNPLFGEGFVTASLVFCIGPMAILGSIQDGMTGDYRLLAVKSALDGFAAVAFAASLGWGVALSAVSILLYQGSITLFASTFSRVLTEPMIVEMTATGGLIIVGISLRLLDLKDVRLASFLPALAIAPLIVALLALFE